MLVSASAARDVLDDLQSHVTESEGNSDAAAEGACDDMMATSSEPSIRIEALRGSVSAARDVLDDLRSESTGSTNERIGTAAHEFANCYRKAASVKTFVVCWLQLRQLRMCLLCTFTRQCHMTIRPRRNANSRMVRKH